MEIIKQLSPIDFEILKAYSQNPDRNFRAQTNYSCFIGTLKARINHEISEEEIKESVKSLRKLDLVKYTDLYLLKSSPETQDLRHLLTEQGNEILKYMQSD